MEFDDSKRSHRFAAAMYISLMPWSAVVLVSVLLAHRAAKRVAKRKPKLPKAKLLSGP